MKNQIYFILMVIFLFSSALQGQNELTVLSSSPDYDQLNNPIVVPYDNSGNTSHGNYTLTAYEGVRNGATDVVIGLSLECDGHGDSWSHSLIPNLEGSIRPIQMVPGPNDSYLLLVEGYNQMYDYHYFNVINFEIDTTINIIWQLPVSSYDLSTQNGYNLFGRDMIINTQNDDIYVISKFERNHGNHQDFVEEEENPLPILLIVRIDASSGNLIDHEVYSNRTVNCDLSRIHNFGNGNGGMVVCGALNDDGLYFFVRPDLTLWGETTYNGPVIDGIQSELFFQDITVDKEHNIVYIVGNYRAVLGHSTSDVVSGHLLLRIGASGVILRAMRYNEGSNTQADEVEFQVIREKSTGKVESYHVYITGTMDYEGFQKAPNGPGDDPSTFLQRKFFLQETDMFCNTRKFDIPSYASSGVAQNVNMWIRDYSVPLDPGCHRNMFFRYEYLDQSNQYGGGKMVIHHDQKDDQSICHQAINYTDHLENIVSWPVFFSTNDIPLEHIEYIFPDEKKDVEFEFVCSHLNPDPEYKRAADLINEELLDIRPSYNSQEIKVEVAFYEIFDLDGQKLSVERSLPSLQERINNSSLSILLVRTVYKNGNSDTQKVVPGMLIMGTVNKE